MSHPLPLKSVVAATDSFLAEALAGSPLRLEAHVSSADGMLLLCAVEEALGRALPRPVTQELVWLNGAPAPGSHVLQLRAFGPDNTLLAQAHHEFAA